MEDYFSSSSSGPLPQSSFVPLLQQQPLLSTRTFSFLSTSHSATCPKMTTKDKSNGKWKSKPPKLPQRDDKCLGFDDSQSNDFHSTNTLAASFNNQFTSPSKDTNISKELARSQSPTTSPSVRKNPPFVLEDTAAIQPQPTSYKHVDDSKTSLKVDEYHLFRYYDDRNKQHNIHVSKDIIERLEECYENDAENFNPFLRKYLIRKHEELKLIPFPFTGPKAFYCLCRVVCKVTHELFADAINYSGILQDFCSADVFDEVFGSVGKWEDVEKTVAGGAGIPPFSEPIVQRIIGSCEERVRGSEPFCRIYILPYQYGGTLSKVAKRYPFYGHIVAVMKPDTLNLRHQREFFEANSEHLFRDWRPCIRTAMVIWVNEYYLSMNPIPSDVDECFTAWALETVGDPDVLDYRALLGAFPDNCRNADERLQQLML